MIDSDLSSELELVRLNLGDSEKKLISDETIDALLILSEYNVPKATVQALQYIVADCAKKVDEEVGDVKVEWSQKYAQLKDLLNKYLKDPAYMLAPALHQFGGVSKTQANNNRGGDNRNIPLKEGEVVDKDCRKLSDNKFFLEDC